MTRRRNWLPSLIWLIPIVAALVGITLVARILNERGPEIVLTFKTAEGLEAGKTAVKYKDVQIGTVQHIRLAHDRSHVRVLVRLNNDADAFTADDSLYWVVRPRLDISGISGLNTLLSGAYIGADPGIKEQESDEFEGLEDPPIITRDADGRAFELHANDVGSLDVGSPIYFRRIKVGQIASYKLDPDGKAVTLKVFVNSPYDKFVGVNTRFWQASGLDLAIDANGLKVRTQSLTTILLGGVAFQAPEDESGAVAAPGTSFVLAGDESSAMQPPDGPAQTFVMYFNESLRGLSPGSPVDFRGVTIGSVKSIGIDFDRGKRAFSMPVTVQVFPERLRRRENKPMNETPEQQLRRLQILIEEGLRAQVRTGNLLTGQKYVAFDFFPRAPRIKVDLSNNPAELPTMPGGFDELQTQVEQIAAKINKLPMAEIASELRTSLKTLNKTLSSAEKVATSFRTEITPQISAALKDTRKTLGAAESTLAQDAPLQQDVRQTLRELTRAASSVRVLTDYLERHPESLVRGKPDDKR